MSNSFQPFVLNGSPLENFIHPDFYYGCAIFGYSGANVYTMAYGFNELDRDSLLTLSTPQKNSLPFPTDSCRNMSLHKGTIKLQRAWDPLSQETVKRGPATVCVKLLKFSNTNFESLVEIYDVCNTSLEFQTLFKITQDYEWISCLDKDFQKSLTGL